MEDYDVYLKDLPSDLLSIAKGNANLGAAGLSFRANFSEGRRDEARASGEHMRLGGMMKERHPGNEEGDPFFSTY